MKYGKNKSAIVASIVVVLFLSACAGVNNNLVHQETVNRFIQAFNQHDVAAMLAETTDTIAWFAVDGESINSQTYGQAQLQQEMQNYFAAVPSVRASLVSISANGNLVDTIEKATWQSRGEIQQLCSRAVYELINNKIDKVYYFPAEDC